jgi:hypothetical protein
MKNTKTTIAEKKQTLPNRIVIGVTGHRNLSNTPLIVEALYTALDKLKNALPLLSNIPITIISPLAEGADRLVVQEFLKMPGVTLEVVLPFEKADYIKDFKSDESICEFEQLLSEAKTITILPPTGSRTRSYEQVGQHVVNQCDILIALWNGKPAAGRGGTQEIVQYARDNGCPLIWINTENPSHIIYEIGRKLDLKYTDK